MDMDEKDFQGWQAQEVIRYVREKYGDNLEFFVAEVEIVDVRFDKGEARDFAWKLGFWGDKWYYS